MVVTLAYGVTDGSLTVPGSVAFTVIGTNNAPVVVGAVTGSATENGAALTLNALASASDPDTRDVLRVTGVPATLPAGVTYTAATHSFTLDPSNAAYQHLALGETQVVTVSYGVTDGIATTAASVAFVVTGVNEAPVVSGAVTATATEAGRPVSLNALANATDVDTTNVLSVVGLPGTLPAGVTYDAATHTFALDPTNVAYQQLAAGETQVVTVTYGVTDGIATTADSVAFTVAGVNNPPVTTLPAAQVARTGVAIVLSGISVADPDHNASETITLTAARGTLTATASAGGTLTGSGTKVLRVTGAPDVVNQTLSSLTYSSTVAGTDTITVVTSDGFVSTSKTLSIAVSATANHVPVIAAGTTLTGSILELFATTNSLVADTATGTVRFTDQDLSDRHTLAISTVTATGVTSGLPATATLLGFLKAGTTTEETISTAGSVPWTFSAAAGRLIIWPLARLRLSPMASRSMTATAAPLCRTSPSPSPGPTISP